MRKQTQSNDDWKPCATGSLQAFAGRERTRQGRMFLTKIAGASAIVVFVFSVGYFVIGHSGSGEPFLGGVTCTTVKSNAHLYIAGKLDARLTEQIRVHLEHCPHCHQFWKEMAGNVTGTVSQPTRLAPSENCVCEAFLHSQLLARQESERSNHSGSEMPNHRGTETLSRQ